jgi:hypothetical protein
VACPQELFDRVRLRVSDVTKGGQLPWSASKLAEPFVFFERSADAPAVVSDQNAAMRGRRLAALSAYAGALERDSLDGYKEFLSVHGADPLAERARAILAVRRKALTWRRTCLIDTPEAYWSYLRRYPHGPHSGDARRRLALLSAALEPPASFALVDYDVPPPLPAEEVYLDRPVIVFADFGFVPPPPFPFYFLAPPPPEFVVLEAPVLVAEPYVLPVPIFVPLPTWCRVPHYAVHSHEISSSLTLMTPSSPTAPPTASASEARQQAGRLLTPRLLPLPCLHPFGGACAIEPARQQGVEPTPRHHR